MDTRKRGRLRKENSRIGRITIRLREEDIAKLDYITSKTNKTKSEVVLEGIQMCYNISLYQD